ncbi:hypothetical protein D9611_005763 [Ephemerocybe angulata]|uniref:FAS1 domain-containing protein n=1 Tax=Ephemerocybe angulata TaxID=980116 RepID=A0A8H5BI63_9AGAR|nr:hypothetical protein D9611_005763 [Tulosesus angulatus]
MRWGCLPVALTAALLPLFTYSAQIPLSNHTASTTVSKTLVDVLSADPDYVSLLRLLQRTRLIPTLNRLVDSTLFAPTNDAIKRHSESNSLWRSVLEDESFNTADNIQEKLRQQLFYHLLNYTLPNTPSEGKVQTHDTLHFPRLGLQPPTREPPPNPPWMPVPGGSLGGKPQRVRLFADDSGTRVGVNAFGAGGASFVKGIAEAANGVVIGIDNVLEPPPDLARVIEQHSSVSYFNKILGPEAVSRLNTTANLTVFLPVDEAWDALDPYERLYLESEFAADDLQRILNMHAVVKESVEWSDSFKSGVTLTTLDGTTLDIAITPEDKVKISDAELVQPDIYASNGVLHLVDSLLIPPNALKLTPEKYLLALNCTTFVSLLHSVDLTPLINDTDPEYTILAPTDDIMSILGGSDLPERGSKELRRLLQYHFLPGRWTPKKMEDGLLLETELIEDGLAGGRQVLPVEVDLGDPKKKTSRHITFGGAGVISEPVHVNNSIIYFINKPITPPADPLETALPLLDLSSFLAAVLSSSQADTLRTTPHTTLLIPRNDAFKRLGSLVSAHLLSPSAKLDLESVLLHHTLDSVEYATRLSKGSQHTFATLEGSDVTFQRTKNDTMYVGASGGWVGLKAEITPRNLLTKTGVIHEVSDILIPRSVQLTVGKLVKAAKGSTMASLVNKAGFGWVLNGTAPPEDTPYAGQYTESVGWTLLCPPDEAFKKYNLTELYADEEGLKALVEQHLIPVPVPETDFTGDQVDVPLNNNRPLVLDDATYSTLRSPTSVYGDIVFQKMQEEDSYVVGIKGARGTDGEGDFARVVAWGRSTTGSGAGGVIQIDRLLVPYQPKWWVEYGAPTAVGSMGLVIICGFFYGVRILWKRDTTEATYEPIGGFGRDDDED